MVTIQKRSALTLFFCYLAFGLWAQGGDYFINEDFSGVGSGYPSEYNGWTFRGCTKPNSFFQIQKQSLGNNVVEAGYAMTPEFGHNNAGDATIYFKYARLTNNSTILRVSVEGEGVLIGGVKYKDYDIVDGSTTYNTATLSVVGATKETRIKFCGYNCQTVSLGYVKIGNNGITLDQASIYNQDFISSNINSNITVNTTRTLTGGIWNTLCLPFDVTMADLESALGYNQDITVRTFKSYNSTTKEITFENPFGGEPPSAIPAGTPFLIKLNTTVKDPTFQAVTIKNITPLGVSDNGVSFVGTYSPVILAADGTNLFLTTRNTLAVPADDEAKRRMNGLRAYFIVPSGFVPSAARLALNDEATDVQSVTMPSQHQSSGTYDLNGRRVEHPRHGLYVVDGRLTFVK